MACARVENIEPLVWRELRGALTDLRHRPVWGESDVNDDLLRVHTRSFFGRISRLETNAQEIGP